MVARATFNGPNVNIETVDVRLGAGHIVASRQLQHESKAFDFKAMPRTFSSARLTALANRPGLPPITGVANFTGHVTGSLKEEDFSNYRVTFDGEGRDVTINGRSAGTVALSGRTENQQLNITLTSGLLGPPQVVAARINLASPSLASSLETTFTNADLTNLFQIVMPGSAVRLSGRVNGTIKAEGNLLDEDQNFSLAGLSGTANFTELSFRVEDVQLSATTPLVVRFTPNEIAFDKRQVHRTRHKHRARWHAWQRQRRRQAEFERQRRFEHARAQRHFAGFLLLRHCGSGRSHQRHL